MSMEREKRTGRRDGRDGERMIKDSLFPISFFGIFLGVLFLMSGIHVGLVVLMNRLNWSELVQTLVPMAYWSVVAGGLTLFTRKRSGIHTRSRFTGWPGLRSRWREEISPSMCPQFTRPPGWIIWM